MAVSETIQEILQGIDDAQYGRDMRQYIHKGIQKCYEEGSAGETDLEARESIEKILEIFGDVEDGDTASKAYAVGDSVVYDGRLYKVIATIAQGDTFTEGTNIEETMATGNVGDIYDLPFYKSYSENSFSKLYVIPSIKLMILSINEVIPSSVTLDQTYLLQSLPIPIGAKHFFSPEVSTVLMAKKTGEQIYEPVYAGIAAGTNGSTLTVYGSTSAYEREIRGQIVAFYSDYSPSYPLSSGTLVTQEVNP